MPSNKDRLYVALYVRAGPATMPDREDTYHWAFLLGPKDEVENGVGMRYHARDRIVGPGEKVWVFEEKEVSLSATSMLLVRVMIAKVEKKDRFISILRSTPIRNDEAGWNCVAWVQEALRALDMDGKALGTSVTDWATVKNAAMEYCQQKDAHRFDGKGNYDMTKAPTYDLVERKEVIV